MGSTYNDKISSIRIYKNTASATTTFFSDVNYGGFAVELPLGTFNVDELAAYGIKNDDITSLKINSGYRVVLYTDNNFSGSSVTYTSDQGWIGDYNDKVSSIKIYKYATDAVANFYNADNSQGAFVGLPLGSYTLSALKEYGIDDNSITSFDLTSGYRVVLYADDNFSGSSTSYTSGQGWLGDLNDKTSSIKIYKYSGDAVANFYNADNSQGAFVGLPLGSFTLSALKEYGIDDNSITSFDLTSGYRVVLYADDNFSGPFASYTDGQGLLGDLNDKTSSIKIYKYSDNAVATFYSDANYGGFSASLAMGTYTLSQLQEYGISDNSISSLKVTSGYKVIAYVDVNFSEASVSYTSDQSYIGSTYNDRISSIQIYKYSNAAVANFYNSDNSQGTSVGLPTGLFTTTNMVEYGIADNSITSFDLQSGYQVTIYTDDNFVGTYTSYTTGQGWLGDFNDQASSIKIYPIFDFDVTDNGGVLTASYAAVNSTETIDKLTDNIATTKYCASTPVGAEVWIQYQSSNPIVLQSYSLTSANDFQDRDPKAWYLQVSDNGADWTNLDSRSNQIFNSRYLKKTYYVNTAKAYQYFRFLVTERNVSSTTYFQLAELQLFGEEQGAAQANQIDLSGEKEDNVTGVNQTKLSNIKIYPNPAADYIMVETSAANDEMHYTVYNVLGVQVLSGQLTCNKIELQKLVPGIYNIVLLDNNEKISHCFIKK